MTASRASPHVYDLAIVGAGPAGLAAGLAASALGLDAAVIGPRADVRDGRTAALFQPSIELLKSLGIWDALRGRAEPLDGIRLVDATGAFFRAPEVTFRAAEIDLDAFGYNIANSALTSALEAAAAGRVHRVETTVEAIEIEADRVVLHAAGGDLIWARLVGAADGRASPTRAAAAIATTQWRYDQAAVVTSFSHSRPHGGISTEFHRRSGPLTVVPGPGATSSLVFVETPAEAARLAALDDGAFPAALHAVIGGLLGTLSNFTPRRVFPISGQKASPLAKNRVALIGETAHVMPPIGAQGLNLSFRDAATLATIAAEAKAAGRDPGADDSLAAYGQARESDVRSRVLSVDLLNRSLLSDLMPIYLARGFGLFALASIPGLRRAVMRKGVSPSSGLPAMMLPDLSPPEIPAALDARPGSGA